MNLDQAKLDRQNQGIEKWISNGAKGTLQWTTGMGKTIAAMLIIQKLLLREPKRTTIVVVPYIPLKDQWEAVIRKWKLRNVKVYVVNTITLNKLNLDCDLLILDELHKYGGDLSYSSDTSFVRVFELIKYRFILGLSATVVRMDDLHLILEEKAPIVDTITIEEARVNGWISPFTEYNLSITLSPADKEAYDKLTKDFNWYFSWFNHDFNLAMGCMAKENRVIRGKKYIGAEEYAKSYGFEVNDVVMKAIQFNRLMSKRKEFLYSTEYKVTVTSELIKTFELKTIVFSESTDFAHTIASRFKEIAVEYHSELKSEIRHVAKRKGNTFIFKKMKFGPTRLKKEALKKIIDNRYKTRVICTARALDVGFDCDDIEMGIIASYTSNMTQNRQRLGRVVRLLKKRQKHAIIVNLYVKESQEEKWLKKSQKGSKHIRWIDSIDQITLET
jgi:superfamily II DNA or RNA helicase